jgi:hypothetical protein
MTRTLLCLVAFYPMELETDSTLAATSSLCQTHLTMKQAYTDLTLSENGPSDSFLQDTQSIHKCPPTTRITSLFHVVLSQTCFFSFSGNVTDTFRTYLQITSPSFSRK